MEHQPNDSGGRIAPPEGREKSVGVAIGLEGGSPKSKLLVSRYRPPKPQTPSPINHIEPTEGLSSGPTRQRIINHRRFAARGED